MKAFPSLTRRVLAYIRREGLIEPGDRVLVGVSGGPDSVALLDILLDLSSLLGIPQLTAAHFDHRLRGAESDEDREFVRELSLSLGVSHLEGSADVLSCQSSRGISLEMAARECRHDFFREALKATGAGKLALGHTADDQAEEILLRITRGTGVSGLAGMAPGTPRGIIRPLLFATREEILAHLSRRNLDYREDSSNRLPFCRRNALRVEGIPALERTTQPGIKRTLAKLADRVRDEERVWLTWVREKWTEACIEEGPGRWSLDIEKLGGTDPALLRRLLRHGWERLRGSAFGLKSAHIEALGALVTHPDSARHVRLPGGIEARVREGRLTVAPAGEISPSSPPSREQTIPAPGRWVLDRLRIEITRWEGDRSVEVLRSESSPHTVFADAEAIRWPLCVRPRRHGDRFHPLGMAGTRKIHDFFVDVKVPKDRRDDVPILCDGDTIVWVVGHRLDDRVKVTGESRAILRLSVSAEDFSRED